MPKMSFRPLKRKPCFMGATDPDFPFWDWEGFFFFSSLLKSCKISHFWLNLKKIWLKSFENNWEYFSNFFLKKTKQRTSYFFEILVLLGKSFLPPEKKKTLKKQRSWPTDSTWKVRPPVKQGFFFHGLRVSCWGQHNQFFCWPNDTEAT